MPWYLSPSGWPTYADTPEESWDLEDRGYSPLNEGQVQAAVDAYNAGQPLPPEAVEFLTLDAARAAFVPFWTAGETVTAGTIRMSPDGEAIERIEDGTTGATWDATEQAEWTVLSSYTDDQAAAAALAAANVFALGNTLVKRNSQGISEWQKVVLNGAVTDPKHATPKSYVDGLIKPLPVPSGGDDTAAVQAALDALATAGGGIATAQPMAVYRLDSGITWDMSLVGIDGRGATFDFGNLTTGRAITLRNSTSDVYRAIIPGGVRNLEVAGPGEATATSGLYLGTTAEATAVPFGSFYNVAVHDFGVGHDFGPHSWAHKFYSCTVYECGTAIGNSTAVTEAGENIAFFGSTFFNSGKCVDKTAGGGYEFFGCSFDYCSDVMFNVDFGHVALYGCHVEYAASVTTPFQVSGDGAFAMFGGEVFQAGAAASDHVVDSTGRAKFDSVTFFNVSTLTGRIANINDEQTVFRECILPAGLTPPADHILRKDGSQVTAAQGWAIGTGAPAPDVTGCTDTRGIVKFGSGAAPAAGTVVDVTYATPYNTPPTVIVTAYNIPTEARRPCITTSNGAGFGIGFQVAAVADQPAGTYWVAYHVIG